jgi:hypothetical protein
MWWAGHAADIGQKRSAYTFLVRKHAGKRQVPRSRLKRNGKIKMGGLDSCGSG